MWAANLTLIGRAHVGDVCVWHCVGKMVVASVNRGVLQTIAGVAILHIAGRALGGHVQTVQILRPQCAPVIRPHNQNCTCHSCVSCSALCTSSGLCNSWALSHASHVPHVPCLPHAPHAAHVPHAPHAPHAADTHLGKHRRQQAVRRLAVSVELCRLLHAQRVMCLSTLPYECTAPMHIPACAGKQCQAVAISVVRMEHASQANASPCSIFWSMLPLHSLCPTCKAFFIQSPHIQHQYTTPTHMPDPPLKAAPTSPPAPPAAIC